MEVETAGRCSAGAGRSRCTLRHSIRRRLFALQRREFAREPATGARPARPMDEKEPLSRLTKNPGRCWRFESVRLYSAPQALRKSTAALAAGGFDVGKENHPTSDEPQTQTQPSTCSRLRLPQNQQGPSPVVVG